jgi:hypothetical protein
MERPRTLPELLRKSSRATVNELHTCLPGKVAAWDATKNLADVELQVSLSTWDDDQNRTYEDPPVLPAVPVVWPRAGGFVITLPLAVGDMVLVIFSETSTAEWRATGQKSKPADARRLSIGHPVCIPGFFPDVTQMAAGDAGARANTMILGKDGSDLQVRIDNTNIKLGASATDFVALASKVATELTKIQTTLASATAAGGGAAVLYGTPYVPSSVAATEVKAK